MPKSGPWIDGSSVHFLSVQAKVALMARFDSERTRACEREPPVVGPLTDGEVQDLGSGGRTKPGGASNPRVGHAVAMIAARSMDSLRRALSPEARRGWWHKTSARAVVGCCGIDRSSGASLPWITVLVSRPSTASLYRRCHCRNQSTTGRVPSTRSVRAMGVVPASNVSNCICQICKSDAH